MNKQQYENYKARVKEFFESEQLNNLSIMHNEAEPYFSWRHCDCCRRKLGGNRYDCNGYNAVLNRVQEYSVCEDCVYYAEYGQLDDMTMMGIEE